MVKAALRDDTCQPDQASVTQASPDVALADDPPATTVTNVNPTVVVKQRVRTGYDDDGVPTFDWTEVVTGTAVAWEVRDEFDADAGMTQARGAVTVLYDGDAQVTESAVVETDDGTKRWRILQVAQVPGMLTLRVERISAG